MEAGEDVGLATVYRVLTQFEAAGLVERHNFDGGHAVFELADGGHHDHMVCVDSGEVIEFFDPEIEKLQKEIVKQHGFDLVDHNLVLYVRKKVSAGLSRIKKAPDGAPFLLLAFWALVTILRAWARIPRSGRRRRACGRSPRPCLPASGRRLPSACCPGRAPYCARTGCW